MSLKWDGNEARCSDTEIHSLISMEIIISQSGRDHKVALNQWRRVSMATIIGSRAGVVIRIV